MMWRVVPILLLAGQAAKLFGSTGPEFRDYPVRPVPFTQVSFTDRFWAPRLEVNRTVTIPFAFKQCEETGRVRNFEIAGGTAEGAFCTSYPFDDSDVYKIIEGASYSLAIKPDPTLDRYVDVLIGTIAAAQEKDGYLYTARTIDPAHPPEMSGRERFSNEYMSHELYNAGHLYEAAYAHFQATGKRTLLDVALKNADFLLREFGPGKRRDAPGHQVVEIGLAKLYRITGNEKYLHLATFFLDTRGDASGHKLYGEYSQDHVPVLQQSEAVGHAVRAVYMYAGMADIAALTGDQSYVHAIDRLWENVVGNKLYLTGGIGSTGAWEGFGPDYDLPNGSAYAETCASIANVMWNHRMFLLHGDAKYIDLLERILYNGALSGYGLSGDRFFYPNPLASYGQHERSLWFSCACCPSNIARFIPSIPGYAYATSRDAVFVNLYIAGAADIDLGDRRIRIEQTTDYPWSGDVEIRVRPEQRTRFTLHLRLPGWAQGRPVPSDLYRDLERVSATPRLMMNGKEVAARLDKGFLALDREWDGTEVITLSLPMSIRRVIAHDAVKEDRGRVAVERGPLVFCAEWPDNDGRALNLVLPDQAELASASRADLMGGITTISGDGSGLRMQGQRTVTEKKTLTLIPYYAWAHRGKGEMEIWLARTPEKARPTPEPTLASSSHASTSGGKRETALNDQVEPASSSDSSIPYFTWWPEKGTKEWVQYDFQKPVKLAEASVYWYDDGEDGECRVPRSWQVLYQSDGQWLPVKTKESYGVEKDRYNTVRFVAIETSALRLDVQLADGFSGGVLELDVRQSIGD